MQLIDFRAAEHSVLPEGCAATVGTFDGVHPGHRHLLRGLRDWATEVSHPTLAVTFDPHPQLVLRPDKPIGLLTDLEEKIRLLSRTGIDYIAIIPFTEAFSQLSYEQFVAQWLRDRLRVRYFLMGFNQALGHDRLGRPTELGPVLEREGIAWRLISPLIEEEIAISSSRIRAALVAGELSKVRSLLGRPYRITGTVVHGAGTGRQLGYPTANLALHEHKLLPKFGIYLVRTQLGSRKFFGVANIGIRPTFSQSAPLVEVNLFDFDEDCYGLVLKVELLEYLREEIRFPDVESLKREIAKDVQNAHKRLTRYTIIPELEGDE